jgi:hypothetical protein
MTTNAIELVDNHFGVFIPQVFMERYGYLVNDRLTEEMKQDLTNPNNEYYWDAWETIDGLVVTYEGKNYSIVHIEDLWLIPIDELEELEELY